MYNNTQMHMQKIKNGKLGWGNYQNGFYERTNFEVDKQSSERKIGHDAEIQINELDITDRNEKFRAHLNVDAEISMKELEEILKSIV